MPRAVADKPYVNFSRGLVTEATGLNYPENSVADILNMDIDANGSVRRRLGIEIENNGSGINNDVDDIRTRGVSVHIWDGVGGNGELRFVVFAIGRYLHIRNLDTDTVSDVNALQPFSVTYGLTNVVSASTVLRTTLFIPDRFYVNGDINFSSGGSEYAVEATNAEYQSASGDGKLFFTSKYHRPFYLSYDNVTKQVSMKMVGESVLYPDGAMLVRDFTGIEEDVQTDVQPTTLTKVHAYNLRNQGWKQTQISAYLSSQSKYPSNAQQWVLGKNGTDDFDAALLAKQDFGNSPAPKGSLFYNVLDGIRDGIPVGTLDADTQNWNQYWFSRRPVPTVYSDYITYLDGKATGALSMDGPSAKIIDFSGEYNVTPQACFTTCAFFAGRVWFAGDVNRKRPNGVYFSKTIEKEEDTAYYMQLNDPTSEHFPDLVDTDGGVLYIQEAGRIVKLVPFGSGVLVFATRGVWFIRGSDSGFRATDYGVDKVSDVGVLGHDSVVSVEGGVVFWTESSIMAIKAPTDPAPENLSDVSIFNFYQRIPDASKRKARGVYDFKSKRVVWLYWAEDEVEQFATGTVYNRALVLDLRTGAFFPYSFAVKNDSADAATGLVALFPRLPKLKQYRSVTVDVSTEEVVVGGEPVTLGEESLAFADERYVNSLKGVCAIALSSTLRFYALTEFSNVYGRDFSNFGNAAPAETSFRSFVQTVPETLGDLQRYKQVPYLHSFFKKTEKFFWEQETGNIGHDRPSGCVVTPIWDWHTSAAGGRYGTPQQAYRFKKPTVALADGSVFDNGEDVVYTKLKMRGQGRTVSFLFEAEDDKDFNLLGCTMSVTANGV